MFKFLEKLKYNAHPVRIEGKSRQLVNFSCGEGFDFFKSSKFKQAIAFDKETQVEQDRFFNELVVTNIVMAIMLIEQEIGGSDPGDRRNYLNSLKDKLLEYYYAYLRRIGVPNEHVETWQKLTDLRHDEYAEDVFEWRKVLMKKDAGLVEDNMLSIFQTLAFGLFRHLRRGETDKEDVLYKEIQSYLMPVFKKQREMIG
jgi:hypothetical protein